ncbi:MAG: DolP-mannose mannosyltransferase [Halorhabdus sp.]
MGRRVVEYWWLVGPMVVLLYAVGRQMIGLEFLTSLSEDPALFYYSGRQWVQAGRVPYRHLWDVKPPLVHEVTALFALVTGGDVVSMHAMGVSLNIGALLSAILGGMLAVKRMTGSKLAAFTTGMSTLGVPVMFRKLFTGFQPKYLFVFLLALLLLAGAERRWLPAAIAAALTAAIWQPGLLLVLLVLVTIEWYGRTGLVSARERNRAGLAVVGVAVLVAFPIVVGNALPEMLVQTVGTPLVTADGGGDLSALLERTHPVLAIVGLLGALGFGFQSSHRTRWWPAAVLVGFGLLAIRGDLDGAPDLIPISLAVAVSVGLAVHVATPDKSRSLLRDGRVWLVAVVGVVVWMQGLPDFGVSGFGNMARLFVSGEIVPRCHIRLSTPERRMMEFVGANPEARTCWRPAWWPG